MTCWVNMSCCRMVMSLLFDWGAPPSKARMRSWGQPFLRLSDGERDLSGTLGSQGCTTYIRCNGEEKVQSSRAGRLSTPRLYRPASPRLVSISMYPTAVSSANAVNLVPLMPSVRAHRRSIDGAWGSWTNR